MKILLISSAQTVGGGERHFLDLVNGFAKRGHEIQVAIRPRSALATPLTAIGPENLLFLPLRNALDAASARALRRIVRHREIQIVHAHMARDYPLAAYATRNTQAKLIITRHVLFPLNRLHAVALAHVSKAIAVSQATAESLKRIMPAQRIVVVPNGIDINRFKRTRHKFDRNSLCGEFGIEANALVVGAVGELKALKGHEEFLRAAAMVRQKIPRAQFVIAGDDSSRSRAYRGELVKLIKELRLVDCVRLPGWVEDLSKFYSLLDVFVSCSRTESFGLSIVEAMASSVPVVATTTAGANEIIEDGRTGLLAPIGDSTAVAKRIIQLSSDQQFANALSVMALEHVEERFSLKRMLDQTEAIYREALQAG